MKLADRIIYIDISFVTYMEWLIKSSSFSEYTVPEKQMFERNMFSN